MGVPTTRIIVFWGLYWGPPILGNCLFFSTPRLVIIALACSKAPRKNECKPLNMTPILRKPYPKPYLQSGGGGSFVNR